MFPVAAAGEASLVGAMDAVGEHRLTSREAMLWAKARHAGCAAIPSEEVQPGRRLSGVELIDPFAAEAASRLDALFAAHRLQ